MSVQLKWPFVKASLSLLPSNASLGHQVMRHAAVAVVFREEQGSIDLLMMRRAEKEGDPWSGQMAFPGGRKEELDSDNLAAAIRETNEEIGLDLTTQADYLGALTPLHAMAQGKPIPLLVSPFLFELLEPVAFELNHEVAEALWIPLHFFLDDSNRTTMSYRRMGVDWQLPCYHYKGRTVWGLSLKMIDEVLHRVRSGLSL